MSTSPVPDEVEVCARGLALAKTMLLALANDDEIAVLRSLNDAGEGEARWCAGYLLSALREAIAVGVSDKPARIAAALRAAAAGIEQDVIENQVSLLVQRYGNT